MACSRSLQATPCTCLSHTLRTRSSLLCWRSNPRCMGCIGFVQSHPDTDPQGIRCRRWQPSTSKKYPQGMEHTRYSRYPPCKSLVGTRCNQAPCKSPCSRGGRGCSLFCRCLSPNRTRRQSRTGFGRTSCSTRLDMQCIYQHSRKIQLNMTRTCRIYHILPDIPVFCICLIDRCLY